MADIRRRQPRAGRAIFLLDQTGFSQVELALVGRILRQLPNAEVILTFAADVLINTLDAEPERVKAVAPLELSVPDIRALLEYRDGVGGRALSNGRSGTTFAALRERRTTRRSSSGPWIHAGHFGCSISRGMQLRGT